MGFSVMATTLALIALVFGGLILVEWVSTGSRAPKTQKTNHAATQTSTIEAGEPMNQTTTPPAEPGAGNFDLKRTVLTLIALFTGSAATIFMLLLASGNAMIVQGLTKMPDFLPVMHGFAKTYTWAVWLPSLAVLMVVAAYSRKHFPALANRIWAGLAAGAVATFVLDTFRQLGVIHGWLPMDTAMLFGKMIAGPPAPELTWLTVGLIYHFLNGASFGVFYTLVFGKVHWLWGVAWGLVVELGMMTAPPMAPLVGPFGSKTGSPALFFITLIAHIGFGIALGLLARHWVKHQGSILSLFVRGERLAPEPSTP